MSTDGCPVQITPEITVADLLTAFPDVDSTLAELSNSYRGLVNPALRSAATKSTTLGQLAQTDGISIGIMIGKLREAAGQESLTADSTSAAPAWASESAVTKTLDAREIIRGGGHPLERVLSELGTLNPSEVYQLITPFVPAPMIELVKQRGFESHTISHGPDLCHTFFRRS
ncbi:MAG: DUF2249 domain-containing protein [Gemmatimonadota bacterium]|nr:MAG: DUF2249 domain-containing protein [Gemmatimonadota bacterium]